MRPRRPCRARWLTCVALCTALGSTGCPGSNTADQKATAADDRASPSPQARGETVGDDLPTPIPGVREFPLPCGPGSFAPTVAAAGELLYLAWYERLADGTVALRFARHDGQAWSPADTLVASDGLGFHARLAPTLGVIDELTVYLAWPERTEAGTTAYRVSRSRGAGKRWSPPATLFESDAPSLAAPTLARDGTETLRLSWVDDAGTLSSITLPEDGDFTKAIEHPQVHDRPVCPCCDLDGDGSRGGHLLLTRSPDASRLLLRTGADHHEVAATIRPEVSCEHRFTALASHGSTLAAAWSDSADRAGACIAFANSPKHWPGCTAVGQPEQSPTGDIVMLDDTSAVLTLSSVANETEHLIAHAVRRDGAVGQAHLVASAPSCPRDACGHQRVSTFGKRIAWFWVDPGAKGQSRIRAAIADADKLR